MNTKRLDAVVIGGGQAGLAAGYYLSKQKRDFVILDAHGRAGDSWRKRWDSLRLFTPTGFNHLPGMPFPKSSARFPTKDEMADYLESYMVHFQFPILFNTKVDELARDGDAYLITAGTLRLKANRVIVASGPIPRPVCLRLPANLTPPSTSFTRWAIVTQVNCGMALCLS